MAISVPCLPADVRRFVVTGVGSSAAHARFLAHLLDDAAFDTRVVPISALVAAPGPAAADEVLIVVSQGLSPNARLALAHAPSWRRVLLLTAATEDGARRAGDIEKGNLLAELPAAVTLCPFPAGENEYETLVRIVGPMAGYLCALRVAATIAPAAVPPWDVEVICSALEAASTRVERVLAGYDVARLRDGVTFLTSGTYGELIDNLRYKVIEGMLLPAPPAWDLLELAHGPLQQAYTGPMTFIALTRRDATPFEDEILGRIERALDHERHALLRLDATIPAALAILEHEALMNELMLRFIAAREIDQIGWPGRDRDRELYEVGASVSLSKKTPERGRSGSMSRLESMTWPELDALLAGGVGTAVVPLGSTEQHGPHLPYATDTWIADALAARFCAQVGDAVWYPTLPLGCASEHLGFPGTLDLRPETLRTVLLDVVRSLARHGFSRTFIFSAHGGNYVALADALPALQAAASTMRVGAYTDLAELTALFHRLSAEFGVSGEASGHHAGEFETSILCAIRPEAVRGDRLAAGLVERQGDPQALFYPSLRAHAPSGVVGDPRAASAARAERYLAGWVELLVSAYRRENPST